MPQKKTANDGSTPSKFSKIKKGEIFKFPTGKTVYMFDGGGKVRGYDYHNVEDTSSSKTTKTDREILIGFTY